MEKFAAVQLAKLLFSNNVLDTSSSNDEDEDLEEQNTVNYIQQRLLKKNVPSRLKNFISETIRGSTAKEFQSHFRITRPMYQFLLQNIGPFLKKTEGRGRCTIDIEKQILSTLWILATPDSYRSIGTRFDMGKSSLFWCFKRVINALYIIAPDIIKWPNREGRIVVKEKFKSFAGIDGVLGAIDGTYVKIRAPTENPQQYVNRKCFHAITLQAIAAPTLQFIDCFAGYPSSVSDLRIFRNSPIYNEFINNNILYFSQNENEFIIGDKAYPLYKWCLPPYIDRGNLNDMQLNFNTAHAKTRQVVERTFALLFGRFRRLQSLDMKRLDLIPKTIIACCVLHNICLIDEDLQVINEYVHEGANVIENEENAIDVRERQVEGEILRHHIAAELYERNV